MMKTCFITVSDIALCQRCPALLGYKLHRGRKTAWQVGINGQESYGTIFHKNIAQAFFEAAYKQKNPLHSEIIESVCSPEKLENLVREKIFMPFVMQNSEHFSSEQIMAMASGVKVWLKAMSEFFGEVKSPDKVFIKPEQKLQSYYDVDDGRLIITGRYDALLFNPDKAEARLFEFKAYNKSDITVPLAQSLVYAWLIRQKTGITPSIEIIYLGEDSKAPDIFDSFSVNQMIDSSLPNLFITVWEVMTLKCDKFPEIQGDKKLCSECKYRFTCKHDRAEKFRKRPGASLVSVLIFTLLAILLTAQVFFFSLNSFNSLAEEREIMSVRLALNEIIRDGKGKLSSAGHKKNSTDNGIDYLNFSAKGSYFPYAWPVGDRIISIDIHNLDYSFDETTFSEKEWEAQKEYERIFPPMPGKYLIRAYTPVKNGSWLMIQEVVSGDKTTIFHQEVWF